LHRARYSCGVTDRLARTPDGETLAFRIHGAPGKTPMLTVHGLVSSIEHWSLFTPHYAQSRPVVSWEFRGHGGQPAPRDCSSVSVAQFADDAHVVARAAELPPAIVIGLSFGVQVALEVWRRHRDAVRALVLICGTAGHPLDRVSASPRVRRTVASVVRGLAGRRAIAQPILSFARTPRGMHIAREITFWAGGADRETCPLDVLEKLFDHAGSLAPELFGAVISAYLEHSAWDMLDTIDVPTLIIAGDKDELTPVATAERLHRAIAGSELVVFAGHTHLVQCEQPREVHAAIDDFLSRHAL